MYAMLGGEEDKATCQVEGEGASGARKGVPPSINLQQ